MKINITYEITSPCGLDEIADFIFQFKRFTETKFNCQPFMQTMPNGNILLIAEIEI